MSRSYKRSPVFTDGTRKTTKEMKRMANQKVRHYKKGLPQGKAYKKLFCSYDIHDYINYWSWSEAKSDYLSGNCSSYIYNRFPNLKSYYNYWSKICKRK